MTPTTKTDQQRLEAAYRTEKPRLLARMQAAGRTLEEAEDLVHDIYAETVERLPLMGEIRSFNAWLNSLSTRRLIDDWRHEQVRRKMGETDMAEDILRDVIQGAGLNPLDSFVRENTVDALNDAIKALPEKQRRVVEAQVFGGMTFKELADITGENIDTLKARKRYAMQNLSKALRHWILD